MNLSKIVSIAGRPGLYKIIAQSKNALIIESLVDKKRASTQPMERVSELENIGFYTYENDVPLKEIYTVIAKKENGGQTISHKESSDKLAAYLRGILPEYDESRVYPSDIKKLFQWYNILQKANLIVLEEEKQDGIGGEVEEIVVEKSASKKKEGTNKVVTKKDNTSKTAIKKTTHSKGKENSE